MSKIKQGGGFAFFFRCLHGNSKTGKQMFEHSLGNYDVLPLLCECKMHEFRNFRFSEGQRPKWPHVDPGPLA